MEKNKIAIIIGAGPAGLTAAFELLKRTDIKPIILEMSGHIGGISKTIVHNGNRMDIGGHRFFSKSSRVMNWWQTMLPTQGAPSKDDLYLQQQGITGFDSKHYYGKADPETTNNVLLIRRRLSRIFFLKKFFNYPISLNLNTILNLGIIRVFKIGFSYIYSQVFKIREEKSLEDFLRNRFGQELYKTFFRDYTKKVWGVPCYQIKPEWGAQRIKGLSISKALLHAVKQIFKKKDDNINQSDTETSLIERFLYPKFGPGQMWEKTAEHIRSLGGEIHMFHKVNKIQLHNGRIANITAIKTDENKNDKREAVFHGDYFFSTMPVKNLIVGMHNNVPQNVKEVANGLVYRDFITVGLLLRKLQIENNTKIPTINNIVPDNWIYIQENEVQLGRLQIFNNWSPYLVKDADTIWLGLEYFCNEGDDLWKKDDGELIKFAIKELEHISIIDANDVLDSTIVRMPKTYPAYFGTYDRFNEIRLFTDAIDNLFLIGRNGMHRYNNQDHSMLSAMVAVDNIIDGIRSKNNIWGVNTESDYHEQK